MPSNIDKWHAELVHVITQQDMRNEKKQHYNIHSLGLHMQAAEEARKEAQELTSRGTPAQDAFVVSVMSNFNPAPHLRTFLRKLDSAVDVRSGRWVKTSAGCSCPR